MKLPFSKIISPVLKPYLGHTRMFCQSPTFAISLPYTYFYGALGFLMNANHLRKHFGELPSYAESLNIDGNFMLLHDLKIIASSMGLVQYACLVSGCLSENSALFLPHLAGQLLIISVQILNVLLLMVNMNFKSVGKLMHKIPAILLMTFNWSQEFCVFRKFLCICDL